MTPSKSIVLAVQDESQVSRRHDQGGNSVSNSSQMLDCYGIQPLIAVLDLMDDAGGLE